MLFSQALGGEGEVYILRKVDRDHTYLSTLEYRGSFLERLSVKLIARRIRYPVRKGAGRIAQSV